MGGFMWNIVFVSLLIITHAQTNETLNDESTNQKWDVLIVGAGLSGLSAARELHKENPNLRVLVVEASEQAGGRVKYADMNTSHGIVSIDIGSQWFGAQHTEMILLANELGLNVEAQALCGERAVLVERTRHRRDISWSSSLSVYPTLNDVLSSSDLSNLTSISIQDFLDTSEANEADKDGVYRLLQTFYDCPENEASAVQLLLSSSSDNGTVDDLLATMGHGRGLRIREGMDSLIKGMVQGIDVLYGENVNSITQDGDDVVVRTTSQTLTAQQVIVAMGPSIASKIEYSPALPDGVRTFLEVYKPRGIAYYFAVTYQNPFWRSNNQSGQIIYAGSDPLLWLTTFDISQNDQCDSTNVDGVLWGIAHFNGDLEAERRYQLYTDVISRALGEQATPIDITDYQFASDALLGGSVGVIPETSDPTVVAFLQALYSVDEVPYTEKPNINMLESPQVHFAGAEYSKVSLGMMNGAVSHGKLVADAVMAKLGVAQNDDVVLVSNAGQLGMAPMRDEPMSSTAESPIESSTFNYETSSQYAPTSPDPVPSTYGSTNYDFLYSTSTQYPPIADDSVTNQSTDLPNESTTYEYQTSTQYPEGVFTDSSTTPTESPIAPLFDYQTSTQYPDIDQPSTTESTPVNSTDNGQTIEPILQREQDITQLATTEFHYETSSQYPIDFSATQADETIEAQTQLGLGDAPPQAENTQNDASGPSVSDPLSSSGLLPAVNLIAQNIDNVPKQDIQPLAARLSTILSDLLNALRKRR